MAVLFWTTEPKRKTRWKSCLSFCVCVRKDTTSFASSLATSFDIQVNIIVRIRTQNDVTAEAVNGVASPTMFCRWQKRCCVCDANTRSRVTTLHFVHIYDIIMLPDRNLSVFCFIILNRRFCYAKVFQNTSNNI